MTRALHPSTRERLLGALRDAGAECALAFAESVVLQVAHPLAAQHERSPGDEAAVLARETVVADEIVTLASITPPADAVPALRGDVLFLSACFQNMDLLPAHGCAAGDRVALRVSDAIARLPHATL